jgi:hypothetical protein
MSIVASATQDMQFGGLGWAEKLALAAVDVKIEPELLKGNRRLCGRKR